MSMGQLRMRTWRRIEALSSVGRDARVADVGMVRCCASYQMCGLQMVDFYMLVRFLEVVYDWRSMTFVRLNESLESPHRGIM